MIRSKKAVYNFYTEERLILSHSEEKEKEKHTAYQPVIHILSTNCG